MTFWFWIGDKICTHKRGNTVRGINSETLLFALANPYDEYTVFDYDILEAME